MSEKIKLIVVFNHRFDKNIDKLRKMYKGRFSSILFLVPFYNGTDSDVVPVYESSYNFQGFFAQRFNEIYENGEYDYYVFAGDDLILNPALNEKNIVNSFRLNNKDAFFNQIIPLHQATFWGYNRFKPVDLAFNNVAVNYIGEIPTKEQALKMNDSYGFKYMPLNNKIKYFKPRAKNIKDIVKSFINKFFYSIKEVDYPLYCGYSDFFIISRNKIKEFSRICGVFAAMNLFVEIAIPTALVLTVDCSMMNQQSDISLITKTMWSPLPEVIQFEKDCDFQISKMNELWPKDYAYMHPLKLSKWKE